LAAEDYFDFDASFLEEDDTTHWPNRSQRTTKSSDEPYEVRPGYLCNRILKPWTPMEEEKLLREYRNHKPMKDLAQRMGRTMTGVQARLEKLGIDLTKDREAELRRIGCKTRAVATNSSKPTQQDRMMSDFLHLIALCQTGYTTVNVNFRDNQNRTDAQPYTYKAPVSMGLAKDDLVVVPAGQTFKIAYVAEVHDEPQIDVAKPLALKWIAQKVDLTAYTEQTQREAEAITKLQVAERRAAQQKALEVLMGSVANKEEFLALLNGTSPA
jgi:hypothetical protein